MTDQETKDEYQSICECGCKAIDHSLMSWRAHEFNGRIPVGPCGKCEDCHQFRGELGPGLIPLSECHNIQQWQIGDEIVSTTGNIPTPVSYCPECEPLTGYICERHRSIKSEAVPLLQQDGSPIPVEPDVLIVPYGMFGSDAEKGLMDAGMRAIAVAASFGDKEAWAEKYGANFENDLFAMHRYCWCEEEDCPWCSGESPNFLYKPTDFRLDWYKYIGRSMEPSGPVSAFDIVVMIYRCLVSIYYMENENVVRIWRCKKCEATHKLVEIPLNKIVDTAWTHTGCGGHWEIVEEANESMKQGTLIDQEKDE